MAEGGIRHNDSGGIPREGSMSRRYAMVQWENESIQTCTVWNWLGYGPHIRNARKHAYRENDRISNARWRGVLRSITSGSKAEGLTCYMESDIDTLFVLEDVICLEDDLNDSTFPEEITVLRSYSQMSYPGHCKLLIEIRGTMITSLVDNAMCDDGDGRKVLSSDLYVNTWSHVGKKSEHMVKHDRAGPSLPFSYAGAFHTDMVHALSYHCPSILKKMQDRATGHH